MLRPLFFQLGFFVFLSIWLVNVGAQVQPQKPRIAVKPPVVEDQLKKRVPSLFTQQLLTHFENAILKTRKFELLSRQKTMLKAVREEQAFAESGLAKGNAAVSGQLENANYLVIPVVQDFVFSRTAKAVPNIDNTWKVQDIGRLSVQAQVIDTTTGAIKATFNVKSRFASKPRLAHSRGGRPSNAALEGMMEKAAAQLADQLVDTVFPMKVLRVAGGQVWINRGQDGGLRKGMRLNVYHPGEVLIDPDTGENLGSAETYAGQIQVERVNPKFTIAKIVKGSDIQRGDIVRKP